MLKLFLTLLFLCLFAPINAQKHLKATSINAKIKIDGVLDETYWNETETATDFIQTEPVFDAKCSQKTEVKVIYNQTSIFIGATLYDVSKDSITTTLSNRDDYGNADNFTVVIDTYGSSTIGFVFGVTSAGVQIDELTSASGTDRNWNAVWESSVKVHQNKWVIELEIPYSAIRFPNVNQQNWRVNFKRGIRRYREESYWNKYDPTGVNFLSQLGYLDNVKGIESPIRLAFLPYVSAYVENYNQSTSTTFNGGMDLKYGVNDAFTIDMTLIPDFGQVQFDNQVLNLSPFEVRYNERRQFFTEGTELFNKAGLFYSRRIGSTPININKISIDSNEIITFNPSTTPLINASKFSGRTKKGLGIGIFNGLTKSTQAFIEDTVTNLKREIETSPITNYNVLVFDQNLKYNSTVTFTNTSVWRAGKTYDANVSALSFDLFTKKGTYNVFGNINVSQIYDVTNVFGYRSDISFDKSSGNFQFGLDYSMADDKYNPNDLGFLRRNNFENYTIDLFYNTYKPFWRLFRTWSGLAINYNKLFSPNVFVNSGVNLFAGGLFKNYLAAGINFNQVSITYDYFEARITNRKFIIPSALNGGGFISTNYAKTFAFDFRINYTQYNSNRSATSINISPRYRISDKLMIIYTTNYNLSKNERGLALTQYYSSVFWNESDPVFGQRDRQTITNSIEANYIFTNRMGLSFKLRHYWSKVEYSDFFVLNNDGTLSDIVYTGLSNDNQSLHNTNFNAFTIDMAYVWVFRRGSELSLVWKNSAFTSNNTVSFNYSENVTDLLAQPFTNSISLKVLYYIDYFTTKNQLSKT
ncbi:MAG TPA: hypothetical protein EYG85_11735 [Crocinitomix sp.]|nr:hypothetical protein [Crocinitomix sp.]